MSRDIITLQGREKRGHRSWVTHYHISYSEDAYRWEWARDIYGDKKVRVTMLLESGDLCLMVSSGGNLICLFLVKILRQLEMYLS